MSKQNSQLLMFSDEQQGVIQSVTPKIVTEHWGIFPEHEMLVQVKGFPSSVKPFKPNEL